MPQRLPPSTTRQHPWPTVALHWLTVLALLIGLGALWWRDALDDSGWRGTLLALHRHMGLLVWLTMFARVLTPLRWPRVDAAGPMPWPARLAAKLSHLILYGLLFCQPLAGWALTNARGQAVQVLGLFELPRLVDTDPDIADLWADRHGLLAWALGGMVALHIAAALWHHFWRHDGVLRSIMPGRRQNPASDNKGETP